MNLLNFPGIQAIVRSGLLIILLSAVGTVRGQTDVIPSSVDLRLVQGASSDQLLIQMKIHSTAGFGGILSALTVTIRYDAASGASLGVGSSFCNAWSAFTPSPMVINDGIAYRSFNGFGINRLEDPTGDGGCGTQLLPEEWFTITSIPVMGDGCTDFTLGNDAYTDLTNRDYYVSMGGHDVTGVVTSGPVAMGDCALDCLGISGGTALPGTPCDDGDPSTNDDTWTADCECVGTACDVPFITGTTNNSPTCSGNVLQLGVLATGTQPLSYAWTGSGSFEPSENSQSVSVTGATTGDYQVTVSNECGSVQASISVVVTTPPSATIAYPSSPYCTTSFTDIVTRTGTQGGTYTASPSGLAFDANSGAIDPASSTAGNYTVTYSIAASGGCPVFSTTASLVITAPPSATIAYASSPYCTTAGTANVALTGSTNGTYSSTPSGLLIDAESGVINATNSDAGSYTVTYSIAASGGCAIFSTSAQVSIEEATTWYADADGDGVGDDAATMLACEQPAGYVAVGGDLCPDDPDKVDPGVCGCGVPDTDTDLDGIPDCIDSCPTVPGEVGDACDDGDPATEDDVITEDCICAGTLTTGIGQVDATNTDFVLYPNPNNTGTVYMQLPGSSTEGMVSIEVHDISGRIIFQTTATPQGQRGRMTLDLPRNMGAGNYTVQVIANGQRYVQRLVMY